VNNFDSVSHREIMSLEQERSRRVGGDVRGWRLTEKMRLLSSTIFVGAFGAAFLLSAVGSAALAGPEGASVVKGTAVVSGIGTGAVTINQSSDRAVLDWRSYSVDLNESVRYNQPGAGSISLNRVTGGNSSQILGSLSANGQVWLVNPAGIFFGPGAQVDVGGLLATTTNISNDSFMAGVYKFDEATSNRGAVVMNRGDISASDGGLVAFVAPGLANSGTITVNFGAVALASGDTFTFDLFGDSLINLTASASEIGQLTAADGTALAAQIVQDGLIDAGGGKVTLSVQSASALVDNSINMSGVIQARTVSERGGTIVLSGGETGTVLVSGTLDAAGNNSGEVGGSIKVLGDKVGLIESASLDVSGSSGGGEILAGGNFQGGGSEQTATFTFVGSNVSLKADALNEGDGGRVIVWADNTTRFSGDIKARGGSSAGNGGFAEVSGKNSLVFRGTADLTATVGSVGTILFDPKNINIVNAPSVTVRR
jgi:filamentous hemagglutinin family protein